MLHICLCMQKFPFKWWFFLLRKQCCVPIMWLLLFCSSVTTNEILRVVSFWSYFTLWMKMIPTNRCVTIPWMIPIYVQNLLTLYILFKGLLNCVKPELPRCTREWGFFWIKDSSIWHVITFKKIQLHLCLVKLDQQFLVHKCWNLLDHLSLCIPFQTFQKTMVFSHWQILLRLIFHNYICEVKIFHSTSLTVVSSCFQKNLVDTSKIVRLYSLFHVLMSYSKPQFL